MKSIGFPKMHQKSVYLLYTCFILFTTSFSEAQNIIYKKDGTQLNVFRVYTSGNVLSYNFINDSSNVRRYIGLNSIDSIQYENGKVSVFTFAETVLPNKQTAPKLLKNSIGLNVWPLFYSKLNIYYDRMFLNNKLGFRNQVLLNIGSEYYPYDNMNHATKFYYSTGLNYYFLQSYFFTMGIGGSFVYGKFYYEYYDPYYYNSEKRYSNQAGIMLNTSFSYVISSRVPISLVLQIPMGFPDVYHPVFLETNIAINF